MSDAFDFDTSSQDLRNKYSKALKTIKELKQRIHELETKLGGPETPLLCLLEERLNNDLDNLKQVPTRLMYLKEWHTCLSWAIDMLDMYDKYLAEKDGYEKVYTDIHIKMKGHVRTAIDTIKHGIEWREKRDKNLSNCSKDK